jgi:hypothetical protein
MVEQWPVFERRRQSITLLPQEAGTAVGDSQTVSMASAYVVLLPVTGGTASGIRTGLTYGTALLYFLIFLSILDLKCSSQILSVCIYRFLEIVGLISCVESLP